MLAGMIVGLTCGADGTHVALAFQLGLAAVVVAAVQVVGVWSSSQRR